MGVGDLGEGLDGSLKSFVCDIEMGDESELLGAHTQRQYASISQL